MKARWRYVVPNAVTCASLTLGLLAVERAIRGRIVDGVWWNLLCVGTDKLDGAAAKWLDAGSPFGVQLDSLADLVSFGVAPAALFYSYYSARGWPEWALVILCAAWLIAAAIRLARFNLRASEPYYLGTPSTMAAGMLLTGFLTVLKYAGEPALDRWKILPLHTGAWIDWAPMLLVAGAAGMLSPLRVPKVGRTRHLWTTVALLILIVTGLTCGALRLLPEYLFSGGLLWLTVSVIFHVRG